MQEHVWKHLEVTGTSTTSIVEAVDKAIKRSHKTLETCAGFRSSKRAAMQSKEKYNSSR